MWECSAVDDEMSPVGACGVTGQPPRPPHVPLAWPPSDVGSTPPSTTPGTTDSAQPPRQIAYLHRESQAPPAYVCEARGPAVSLGFPCPFGGHVIRCEQLPEGSEDAT